MQVASFAGHDRLGPLPPPPKKKEYLPVSPNRHDAHWGLYARYFFKGDRVIGLMWWTEYPISPEPFTSVNHSHRLIGKNPHRTQQVGLVTTIHVGVYGVSFFFFFRVTARGLNPNRLCD